MTPTGNNGLQIEDERLEQAVEWFLRVRSESACIDDLSELRRWMEGNELNAAAYQQVSASWSTVGEHASAPEIVVVRRDALLDSHAAGPHSAAARTGADSNRRIARPVVALWTLAACLLLLVGAGAWWLLAPQSTLYSTPRGQQRTVTLGDGSVVMLDALSRVRVRYTDKERAATLEQGQARFTVAKDPLRPFRVRAREQTVVALGTEFDVELITRTVLVTLIEGHVAVAGVATDSAQGAQPMHPPATDPAHPEQATPPVPVQPPAARPVIELTPGQALRVRDGHGTVLNVDLARATAWQRGKMFFDNEPLSTAVERINRYAPQPIEVDPAIASFGISGAFNAGDTEAFIDAVTNYFPVAARHDRGAAIHLTRRN